MLALKQILAPVDFSAPCLAAVKGAVLLADRFDAELTVAHVIDRFPYQGTEMEIFYGEDGEVISGKDLDSRFRNRLHEFTGSAAGEARPTEVLRKGDPAKEIAQLAEEQRTDLIVVPTHGHGPFRKFLLGSVTAKILHDANCTVLTGSHLEEVPPAMPQPYQRIGCATDLGDQSEPLLRWADGFARALGAKLVLIHATALVQVIVDDAHIVTADWRDMVVQAAEQQARGLLKKLDCEADICIGNGHPVHFVTNAAVQRKLDALIIGRGMAKRRGSRLPTHAYGIIREAPCPVISLA